MFLFPARLLLGGDFLVGDYLIWNEIPIVIGNLVGGLTLYATHARKGSAQKQHPTDE